MEDFISNLFRDPDMLRMGHDQRLQDNNLGLGWLYYALGRILRCRRAVVIGSYRGFSPALLAKAMLDNIEGGEVTFIDPSMADDFWNTAEKVKSHFFQLSTPNIAHFCMTTQEFVKSSEFALLSRIGLLMIDGFHSAEQARYDYLAFIEKLDSEAVVMFHDSVRRWTSPIYGKDREYDHTVYLLMERLRQDPGLEVFSLPFGGGITLVRGKPERMDLITQPFDLVSST
jgi:hypothetical protein